MGALEEQAHQTRSGERTPDHDPALPYHVTVKPGGEDQESRWIASVDELPGCEAGGDSPDQAVENLRAAMEGWLSAAAEEPRVVPPPRRGGSRRKRASTPSGRFLVRMPSDLHEELARAAEREQVSLNRFVTSQLAASVSPGASPAVPDLPAKTGERRPAPQRSFRMLLAANLAIVILAAAAAIALLVLALERGV